jgi:hypothetical protein
MYYIIDRKWLFFVFAVLFLHAFFKWFSRRFLSFEFAHIVLLFVGINFVVESFLLVMLIESRNKVLLSHDNSSSEQLLLQYSELQSQGGIMKFLFDYGLVSIPVPTLREKIEYKIIQEYFVRSYNLPPEFKFANYLCTLLKNFVISLIEVRPISWLIIAFLVVLNFLRVVVIDPIFEYAVCDKFPTHFHYKSYEYGTMDKYFVVLLNTYTRYIPCFNPVCCVLSVTHRTSCMPRIHAALRVCCQHVSYILFNWRVRRL